MGRGQKKREGKREREGGREREREKWSERGRESFLWFITQSYTFFKSSVFEHVRVCECVWALCRV